MISTKTKPKSVLLLLLVVVLLSAWSTAVPNSMTVDLSDLPLIPHSQHSAAADTQDYIDSLSNVDSHADHGTHDVFADLQGYEGTMDYFLEGNTGTAGANYENFIDAQSNIDSHADHGTHSAFANLQAYDSTYDTMTEANTGGTGTNTHDYVDNTSNLHAPSDIGTHSSFAEEQDFDAVFDTLTEADAGSAATNYNDYVDTTSSNVDSHADHGTHSNFANQQSAPDTVTDQLLEANVPLSDVVFGQSGSGSSYSTVSADYAQGSVWTTNGAGGTLTDGHVYCRGASATNAKLVIFVHSTLNILTNGVSDALAISTTAAWKTFVWSGTKPVLAAGTSYILAIIPQASLRLYYYGTSAYGHQDTTNSYTTPADMGTAAHINFEYRMYIHMAQTNYELDIEEAWTAAPYSETNEELCIRTTSWSDEAVKVQVWNGAWNTVIASLVAGSWNNVSVSSYLTSATFTIRFQGNTETLDIVQGYWNIDSVLLHCWSAAYVNYRLDLEVGWTAADYDEINEYLCLRGGTQNAEALMVDVWSGAAWVNVIADVTGDITAPEWNNVSISSYLTSSAFEIRFIDASQSSDSSQGTWQVEAVLLHVWGNAVNYELDLEMDWTTAQYSETYEYIDIKTAAFAGSPAESLYLDVWYSSAWQRIGAVSANTWNNLSISSYLTSATLYMRLLGQTETTDTAQNTFQVDCVILHCWTPAAPLYELDLEGQWTAASYSEVNEQLCIYAGTQDAEALMVDVWNGAGWTNVIADLTASAWNNVSVSTWLTSANFYIRFLGGSESSDTTQSGWNVDCALLHTWTGNPAPVNDAIPTCADLDDTNNIYSYYEYYSIIVYVSDASGYADIATIDLYVYDDARGTNYWIMRYTEDTNIFSEQSDASDYVDMSGSSASRSGNDIDATFEVRSHWTHPDVLVDDMRIIVTDSLSQTDDDYYETNWDWESDLEYDTSPTITSDPAGTIDRGDLDETFHITGKLSYQGSALIPSSATIDAWVGASEYGTNVGPWEDDTVDASGNFDVTCYADNAVGQDTYTIKVVNEGAGYAGTDIVDGTDPTDLYIADRAQIQAYTVTDTRVDISINVNIDATLYYDYDNTAITTGSWTINTYSAAHQGSGVWRITRTSATVTAVTYDTVAGSDTTHGLNGAADQNGQTKQVIWDQVQVQSYTVADSRVNINDNVNIDVLLWFDYDNSQVTTGTVTINGYSAAHQGSGVWRITRTSATVTAVTYNTILSSGNTYGITVIDQNGQSSTVIWDQVLVLGYYAVDSRVNLDTNVNIDVDLIFDYDDTAVTTGTVHINGFSATHAGSGTWRITRARSTVTAETYDTVDCSGNTYGITSVNQNGQSKTVIWDQITVQTTVADDSRVNMGANVEVRVTLWLEYDDTYLGSGDSVSLNGTAMSWDVGNSWWELTVSQSSVCGKVYLVSAATETGYSITTLNVNSKSVTVIWDRISVIIDADDYSADNGVQVNFTLDLSREYDSSSLTSYSISIIRNGTYWHTFTDGNCSLFVDTNTNIVYLYNCSGIADNTYTLTLYVISGTATITWSEVNYAPVNIGPPTFTNPDDGHVLYARYRFYVIIVNVSDANGWEDINYVELNLFEDTRVTLIWTLRYTVGTSTFSVESGSDKVVIASWSYVTNTTTVLYIYFVIKIDWDHDDLTAIDTYQYVIDVDDIDDIDWYESDWDTETRLDDTTFTCQDSQGTTDRGDINGWFYASGTLYFYGGGGNDYPLSNETDVWISCSDVSGSPWSDLSLSSGAYSAICYADDVVGLDTYTLRAVPEGTGSGGDDLMHVSSHNATYIADRLQVQSYGISDSRVNINDNVNIWATLWFDYDNSQVTTGTVTINGYSASHVGSGVWSITRTSSTVIQITYDTVAASGNTHGITEVDQNSQSTAAIWDHITVQTTVADNSRVNMGANVEVRVTLWREYDDTYLGSGNTIKLNNTMMSWDAGNAWWELTVTNSTVISWVYVVDFAYDATYFLTTLDTNGQSVAVIWDRVQVQEYTCADNFVNTGAYLPFYVRLFYDYDNSAVVDGTVTVNSEPTTYYGAGLWRVNVTKATSQSVTYNMVTVNGNEYGITTVDQNGKSLMAYWDRVMISLTSTNDNRTGTGQYALISVAGAFEVFSHSLGAGDTVMMDGQAMTWNATSGHFELSVNRVTVGNYTFFVNSTSEATYGITAFDLDGHSVYVTFDKVHLVLSSNMGWTVVGYNVTISGAGGHYEYDSAPWTGTFDIDSMGAYPHYDTAQNKTVQASSVTDPTYGITTVINDPCYVVWDDALISSTAYFWTQYSIEQVWLLWASGTWTWEINGTTIDTGADGYCIIQSHMNGTEDDWAIVNSGDIGDLIIGSFNPSWYYANVTIAVETTINGRAYDWAVWSAVLSVDIMHTIQITGSGMDVEDVWITFIIHSNWNNATFTVWDNDTVVGYSQWEGWYQVAKPTVVGLHNYTLLVNGTHSGSYSNQTKNFAESDSWVWLNFKYTVNPVELSFDEVSFNQNNESVMVTGRVWTSSTTLYYTVYEATLGWTSGMISGVTSGSWLSWMWDKSSVTSTSNFTVTMTDSTYNVTFRGFYLRIAGNQWITYGSSVTEDHRTYVQNSSIIYDNPPGFFIDQGTATILAVGGVIIAMFALMVSKQIVKSEILKGIRKGLTQ